MLKIAGGVCLIGATVCLIACPAAATNRVVVESATVAPGEELEIGVYIENDMDLSMVAIPLVIRSVDDNVYPTAITASLNNNGRFSVGGSLEDISLIQAFDVEDGSSCRNGMPGGFHTAIGHDELLLSIPTPSNPDAIQFARLSVFPEAPLRSGSDFPVGSDNPSYRLQLTAPTSAGSCEIDTSCIDPSVHLLFVTYSNPQTPNTPAFTKGIVDVSPCDCPHQGDYDNDGYPTAYDLREFILYLFFHGHAMPADPNCPGTRFDFNYDGAHDAVDLNLFIGYLYFNGSYCDPCNPIQPECY